jgi:tRNA (cmo5U34)-methyltransferase
MNTPLSQKSSTDTIRQRFDADVERFSQLETGQAATMDAPLCMELITEAAVASTTPIQQVLDIGCGAGNNTLRLLQAYGKSFACDLCDLSTPMLERARQRVSQETTEAIHAYEGDFRTLDFEGKTYDVILAAAVLHHLRDDRDWTLAFEKIHALLRPGGSVWITDLVAHENEAVHQLMWTRYGEYLEKLGGQDYRDKVFAYIDLEDSPRPLTYQLDLLRKVGFQAADVLHKNGCFAAFGAIKAR